MVGVFRLGTRELVLTTDPTKLQLPAMSSSSSNTNNGNNTNTNNNGSNNGGAAPNAGYSVVPVLYPLGHPNNPLSQGNSAPSNPYGTNYQPYAGVSTYYHPTMTHGNTTGQQGSHAGVTGNSQVSTSGNAGHQASPPQGGHTTTTNGTTSSSAQLPPIQATDNTSNRGNLPVRYRGPFAGYNGQSDHLCLVLHRTYHHTLPPPQPDTKPPLQVSFS